ncbi:MAG: DUF3524 domain-containing protein [Chloroflexota bacterium]
MRILLISPYHGGSHQAWAEGYAGNSTHEVQILSLPARFWKWRMEGGAITLARMALPILADPHTAPDMIVATDMLDLAKFLALTRPYTAQLPAALYMHENQLTYPLPDDPTTGPMRRIHGARDRHYVMINLTSMLAADRIYFNSDYHRQTMLNAIPSFLRHYPEYNEEQVIEAIQRKSSVLAVGINFARLDPPLPRSQDRPPLVLWNQRWEYDKNPDRFVATLNQLAVEGLDFEAAFCGERFGLGTVEVDEGIVGLGDRVIHNGYANDSLYRQLLWSATATFSTAKHEYFGISILEAIHCRTFPILPRKLTIDYPEQFHDRCLVKGKELLPRLRWAITHRTKRKP